MAFNRRNLVGAGAADLAGTAGDVAWSEEPPTPDRALALGAARYLEKGADLETIMDAIEQVAAAPALRPG